MKSTLGFILFVLVVTGVLYAISGKPNPHIPDTPAHMNRSDVALCLGCHAPGKEFAVKETHPPKTECFKCHKVKRNVQR